MSQGKKSGQVARAWGLNTARKIAIKIGATKPQGVSNACIHRKRRVAIKCARRKNRKVEVSFHMLQELDFVYGAFFPKDHICFVWKLPAKDFKELATPRNIRQSREKVRTRAQISKKKFEKYGALIYLRNSRSGLSRQYSNGKK